MHVLLLAIQFLDDGEQPDGSVIDGIPSFKIAVYVGEVALYVLELGLDALPKLDGGLLAGPCNGQVRFPGLLAVRPRLFKGMFLADAINYAFKLFPCLSSRFMSWG